MSDIIGIMAILKNELRTEVLKYWDVAEYKYKSKGVKTFDNPNLTFCGGECDNILLLEQGIEELSRSIPPFEIIVDGIGSFTDPSNVIFFRVKITEDLKEVHKMISDEVEKYCINVFEHYTTKKWLPHITIAMNDITKENFERFISELKEETLIFNELIQEIQLVKLNKAGKVKLIKSWICSRY